MVREDIVAGLKNAVERGYSLEQAKQSFISAGYSKEEVEEASNFIHGGSVLSVENKETGMLKTTKTIQQPEIKKPEKEPFANKLKRNFKIVLLIIILMVLIALLIMTLIFRDKIIGLFS